MDAQILKPGFDKAEYAELLKVFMRQLDTPWTYTSVPPPEMSEVVYRSPESGFKNRWDLAMRNDGIPIICIRGTIQDPVSWMANFYAAMVPAKGKLKLKNDFDFEYKVAEHPRAAVHIGWLIATAYLSQTILPKIDSLYNINHREFIIMGHSQGGAIAYIMTSYLEYLKSSGRLGKDIRFKTYCSAAPKPGNLYYAYDYENLTRGGWAYNVVNAADWVPETPVSVQSKEDFNKVNPFANAQSAFANQKFAVRVGLKHVYNKLTKYNDKAQKYYRKYLGSMLGGMVKKSVPDYVEPEYEISNAFTRCGNMIVLMPDEKYYQLFPDDESKVFIHHLIPPYLYLLDKWQP